MSKKNPNAMTKSDINDYANALVGKSDDAPIVQLETVDDATIASLFNDYEMSPPIVDVGERQLIKGIYHGNGTPVEMSEDRVDPRTGEVSKQTVSTHVFETLDKDGSPSGVRFRVMGSHQLDLEMSRVPVGARVAAVKGTKKETGKGGRSVRQWLVGVQKEGK